MPGTRVGRPPDFLTSLPRQPVHPEHRRSLDRVTHTGPFTPSSAAALSGAYRGAHTTTSAALRYTPPRAAGHSALTEREGRPFKSEQLHAAYTRPGLLDAAAHLCYYARVTSPNASLLTIHYPLSAIHYGTPLFHFVPPCSTPDTNRGTPPVPFFGKVFHRPDRNGTLWNTMEQLTEKSTTPPRPRALPPI